MAYLLDSNCYIEPRNDFYGMDICPGYWAWILRDHKAGVLYSIDRVREELVVPGKKDDIAEWAKARDESFFLPALTDTNVLALVGDIGKWLLTLVPTRYKRSVVDDFMDCADPFLVAYAKVHKHIVVTQEAHDPLMKRKVGITIVCEKYGVEWMHLLDFLKLRGPKFVLEPEEP